MIKPISGWVLVQPNDEIREKAKTSGIILSDNFNSDMPQSGKVIAVGPDEYNEYGITRKSPVNVGDDVLFKKWGGNEINIEDKKYLFVRFEDFIAIK